ncbi:MAG: hypothetical protein ACQEP1_01315 [Nanobdellota archaeon]
MISTRTSIRIISVLSIIIVSLLILKSGEISLLKEPLSMIGNMEGNYPLFLAGTGIVIVLLPFVIKRITDKLNAGLKREHIAFALIGITAILLPYNDEMMLSKAIHTFLGIAAALVMTRIIYVIDKDFHPENKAAKFISRYTPIISILGTFALFIITGLNTIIELFYFATMLIWFNTMAQYV